MKRFISIIIAILIAQSIIKSNKYEVISYNDGELLVNRKGDTLKFYSPAKAKAGDSIRLFADYDYNYKSLILK